MFRTTHHRHHPRLPCPQKAWRKSSTVSSSAENSTGFAQFSVPAFYTRVFEKTKIRTVYLKYLRVTESKEATVNDPGPQQARQQWSPNSELERVNLLMHLTIIGTDLGMEYSRITGDTKSDKISVKNSWTFKGKSWATSLLVLLDSLCSNQCGGTWWTHLTICAMSFSGLWWRVW